MSSTNDNKEENSLQSNFFCKNNCCLFKIVPYKSKPSLARRQYKKAGVFIHDNSEERVLLVQSRGRLWGLPKGTVKVGETERECAVREVREETGLSLNFDDFTKAVKIRNRSLYFYTEMKQCDLNVQTDDAENDANGICWLKISCLCKCIYDGTIKVNQDCRIVFRRLLGKELPYSSYTEIKRKQSRKRRNFYGKPNISSTMSEQEQ